MRMAAIRTPVRLNHSQIRAYRRNALENPHFYDVMLHDTSTPRTSEHGSETFNMLADAVQGATESQRDEARIRADRQWAYIHGLWSLELSGLRVRHGCAD